MKVTMTTNTTSNTLSQYLSAMKDETHEADATDTTASATTMLSLQSNGSCKSHTESNTLWKYHAHVFEESEARASTDILKVYRSYMDRLRVDVSIGVAETFVAETVCQNVTDGHATLGEAIRPNDDETEILLDATNTDGVVEVAAPGGGLDEATAAATAESISLKHTDADVGPSPPVSNTHKKHNIKKGEPPVTYISFPNAQAADEAVYVLHKQQTAMSNVLSEPGDASKQSSELQRSLDITDRLDRAETLYQDLVKQERKVQLLLDKYCRLAETILPARATEESIEHSTGDLWLAEMDYRRAAGKLNYSALRDLLQDMVQSHTARRVNLWKRTEQQAFREPADMFGKLEALHTDVMEELSDEVYDQDIDARMRQIAEFHGTTALADQVPSIGVDVDTYLGCDTDEEDEESGEEDSAVDQRIEPVDDMPIVLDKTSKGYSDFMEKYLFTGSLLESHFVKFSAVAGYLSGKETIPSRTSLLIVTNDSYLHIFNLGNAIPLQAAPTVAMRHVGSSVSAETTILLAVCQIRATRFGIKITNKSSASRRGYKFVLENDADRQYLLQLENEEAEHRVDSTTIACI